MTIVLAVSASVTRAPFAADRWPLKVSFLSRSWSPITPTVNVLWRWRGLKTSAALSARWSEAARAVPSRVVACALTDTWVRPTARR